MNLSNPPSRTPSDATPSADALPSAIIHPLDDNERLVELYAAVLDETPEAARRRLYQEELRLGEYHMKDFATTGIEPHVWSHDLINYYAQSDSMFIGAAAWNRRAEKVRMRQWIGEYLARDSRQPRRVLVIGDGAGFDSMYLAECGHEVTYFEVSGCAFQFARRIFDASDKTVKILDDPRDIPDSTYDVVVCLDVLEHVPDPPAMVADFARCLKPDGTLIVHAPFFFLSPVVPTHLKANRKYSGDVRRLYRPSGFRLVDGRWFWDPAVFRKTTGTEPALSKGRSMRARALRLTGLLLAVGRYWSSIHNWFAHRAFKAADPRWARQFGASMHAGQESTDGTKHSRH